MSSHAPDTEQRHCKRCLDDGWIDVWDDDEEMIIGEADCPHLYEPWHRPFNASGALTIEGGDG